MQLRAFGKQSYDAYCRLQANHHFITFGTLCLSGLQTCSKRLTVSTDGRGSHLPHATAFQSLRGITNTFICKASCYWSTSILGNLSIRHGYFCMGFPVNTNGMISDGDGIYIALLNNTIQLIHFPFFD
jgi:hypothetical protein